jgi:hypothetical protein
MSQPRPEGLRWSPPIELRPAERLIAKRLKRSGRLFLFLREHRHNLFDEAFQEELAKMYSDAPRGVAPRPPALLAMVTLLQAYENESDAGAVECAVFDRRWQMVLDCLGADEAVFSQGVLVDFRRRLIAHNLDRRMLERTVELARETGKFGFKQLRVALDSSPLWGAGRVEDTFNLLGHALGVVIDCAAMQLKIKPAQIEAEAGLTLLGGSSLKAELDIDWDDPKQQDDALMRLLDEVRRLRAWVDARVAGGAADPPLKLALELLERVIAQDLEPDPAGGGRLRIRRGVARDRRISVTDPDMRHGRKSKSRLFNGYKRHVARELESGLILAAAASPANQPEHELADALRGEVESYAPVEELHIDRGYLASAWAAQQFDSGKPLLSKPWPVRNGDRFPKTAFKIDLARKQVRCPEQQIATIEHGRAQFDADTCAVCPSQSRCTRSASGRSVSIHEREAMLIALRTARSTPEGRVRLRQRLGVEHTLAHLSQRQGNRARYRTLRKNTFDLRRHGAIINLQTADRLRAA